MKYLLKPHARQRIQERGISERMIYPPPPKPRAELSSALREPADEGEEDPSVAPKERRRVCFGRISLRGIL